ncbi:MAG: hypothetical protein COB37_00765 [Kordiimonadales bacterium]|nr:MAG: hypothetical protein COB37_00765 [Kordiimonadales bacterium]
MQLIKAIGEDELDIPSILSNKLVGLSIARLMHGGLTCLMLDFGLPKRLWLQIRPVDFDDDLDVGVLTFRWTDSRFEDEQAIEIKAVLMKGFQRFILDYEDRNITTGIRISFEGDVQDVDILSGQNIFSLAVFGWGFAKADQATEVCRSEYKFLPW